MAEAAYAIWHRGGCGHLHSEESMMLASFGETYERYRRSVPQLAPWHRPSG